MESLEMKNTYNQCTKLWTEKDLNDEKGDYKQKGEIRNNNPWDAYELLRRVWDGFFRLVPRQHQCLFMIRQAFISDDNCKKWRPFGSVKDFKNRSHYYVFESYMKRLEEVLWSDLYDCFYTIEQVIYQSFVYGCEQEGVRFTKTSFRKALTLYMYRLAEGTAAEPRVVREFNKQYLDSDYSLELAEEDFESFDIDAFLVNIKYGAVYPVSIKTMKALGYSTIKYYRSIGKTKPVFYIGWLEKKKREIVVLNRDGLKMDLSLFKPAGKVDIMTVAAKKEELRKSKRGKKKSKSC